jgi:hypothetical protein
VDSFFDITYRIDFVGAPGGPLGGMSGSTTGTIRMQAGGGGGGQPAGDPCATVPRPNPRAFIVKAVHEPKPPCACYPPAGLDALQTELSHRIRLFGLGPDDDRICDADMRGPIVIRRSDPRIDPITGRCSIDTELVQMELRGVDPDCGVVIVRLNPTLRSMGQIVEKQPGTCFLADSFFDVFVEIELPSLGLVLRNCSPARMACMIGSIPPYDCSYQLTLSGVNLFRPGECANLPNPDVRPTGVIEVAEIVPRQPCDDCPEYGPGVDAMNATLSHDVALFGIGGQDKLCTAPLTGAIEVERGVPFTGPDGLCCVTTRLTKLDLAGDDPVCGPIRIRLCPDRPSRGTICQTTRGACFPAQSCFDVFIEVEVMGMVLKNCRPARMCCRIGEIPPFGCAFELSLDTEPLLLFRKGDCDPPGTVPLGEIRGADLTPQPPDCALDLRCSVAGNQVVLAWSVSQPDCCDEFRITRDGQIVQTVPGNIPGRTLSLPCRPGLYCVECVKGGVVVARACCEVVCPCPPDDPIASVACDPAPATNELKISWTLAPGADVSCCVSYAITKDGVPIATAPSGATSVTVPCMPGDYGVQCVRLDGGLGPVHSCTVTDEQCPPPCGRCVPEVECTVADGFVRIVWTVPASECNCRRFEVFRRDAGGVLVPLGSPPAGQNELRVPCRPGDYCVRCVCEDGSASELGCCTVSPTQCGPGRPRFKRGDADGDGQVTITDGIRGLNVLFIGQGVLNCLDAADADDSGQVTITDSIRILNVLFLGLGDIPAPGILMCGEDPTSEALECDEYDPAKCEA